MASNTRIKVKQDGDIIAQFMHTSHALLYIDSLRANGHKGELVVNYHNKKDLLTVAPLETITAFTRTNYEMNLAIDTFERESEERMDKKIAQLRAQVEANRVSA